ncbi:pleckstrin homology domain-containing family A member 4 [Chelonia mydas]|uniref:pleckstrin homology domain-containing family A member 4 n=1 Tax=Chelonia mydas TaxID=8469 RepID=UPI001CAA3AC5|nr:pleckstrin homology domain-containing family A member 4 [Chelonia mydas]
MADGERPRSSLSQASSVLTISSVSLGAAKPSRSLRRVHTFGKRENSIKRDPNAPVVIRGWLCKQDSSGLKLWKRRWFVLADFCLFYYRDSREEAVLGSIPLPSYEIRPLPGEGKNRRFTFKAEHRGMRTYHFSADTQEDMNGWIRAMSQSAAAESDPSTIRRPPQLLNRPAPPQARLFEDVRPLTPDLGPAKSVESLEIALLSAPHSSTESLAATGQGVQGEGGPLPSGPAPPPSPVNGEGLGGEPRGLSSLSTRILRGQEPSAAKRPHPGPPRPSPPPCPPESEQPPLEPPSPWEPSPDAQRHVRSSRSYSLPPTPGELREVRGAQGGAWASTGGVRAPELAASCEELPLLVQAGSSLSRPHTPVGRVDIAPGGAAWGSRAIPGRPQTPADRYDVRPSEESCGRPPGRYPRSPHPSHCLARPGTPAEESPPQTATLGPALGRQPRSRFTDRVYPSLGAAPPRARLHGRLISPHSASSGYLHLPPLPPLASRPPGKRTSLGAPPRTVAPLSRDRTLLALPRAESDTDVSVCVCVLCPQSTASPTCPGHRQIPPSSAPWAHLPRYPAPPDQTRRPICPGILPPQIRTICPGILPPRSDPRAHLPWYPAPPDQTHGPIYPGILPPQIRPRPICPGILPPPDQAHLPLYPAPQIRPTGPFTPVSCPPRSDPRAHLSWYPASSPVFTAEHFGVFGHSFGTQDAPRGPFRPEKPQTQTPVCPTPVKSHGE